MTNKRTFFWSFAITFFCASSIFGVVALFLWRSYELSDYREIVDVQLKKSAIYRSAFNGNLHGYKLELAAQRQAEILALGSSRVMQFRQEFFDSTFSNAGGSVGYVSEGKIFIDKLIKRHKPSVVILGLDFWWFNENSGQVKWFPLHQSTGKEITRDKLLQPLLWLMDGKISWEFFKRVLLEGQIKNRITQFENMGIPAIKMSDGFRPDGSYQYTARPLGLEDDEDKFQSTLEEIEAGNGRFIPGVNVNTARVVELKALIKEMQDMGIKVVIMTAPLAPAVLVKLEKYKDRYAYINKFLEIPKSFGVEYYNFHQHVIAADECEYIDGIHPGDVIYQKMLLSIAESNPGSILAGHIAKSRLEKWTDEFAGLSVSPINPELISAKEVDFQNLNCKKKQLVRNDLRHGVSAW